MSDRLIAGWRRIADRQDGPDHLRIDRSALLGLVEAAERLRAERDEALALAHNATIAAPVPAVAPPTAETHPDSPETSEGRTAPLPPPVVPRCDDCRWWGAHTFDGECRAIVARPRSARTTGPLFTLPHHHCAMWAPETSEASL